MTQYTLQVPDLHGVTTEFVNDESVTYACAPSNLHASLPLLHSMEKLMLNIDEQFHTQPDVRHYLGTGTYCRVMSVQPDTLVSGRMHRGSTVTIILSGDANVYSSHGLLQRAYAGEILITPAKTKRLWYSANGCEIMTIHSSCGVNSISLNTLQYLENEILLSIEEEYAIEQELNQEEQTHFGGKL